MNKLFHYKQQSAKLNPNSTHSPVSPSTQASSSQLLSYHKRGTSFSNFSSPINNNSNLDIIEIISSKEKDLIGADIRLMGYLKRSIDGVLTSIDSPATRKSSIQKSFASLSPMSCFYDQTFDDSYDKAQNNPFNSPHSVRGYYSPSQGSPVKGQGVKSEARHKRSSSAIVLEEIETKKNFHNEQLYQNFETFSAYENEDFASKVMDSSHENGRKERLWKKSGGQKDSSAKYESSEESFSNRVSFLENSRPKEVYPNNTRGGVLKSNNKNLMEKEKVKNTKMRDSGHYQQVQQQQQQQSPGYDQRKKQGQSHRASLSEYEFDPKSYQSPVSNRSQRMTHYDSPQIGKGSPVSPNVKYISKEEKLTRNTERMKNLSKKGLDGVQRNLGVEFEKDRYKEMVRDLDHMHFEYGKLKELRKQGNLVLEEAAYKLRKGLNSFKNKEY